MYQQFFEQMNPFNRNLSAPIAKLNQITLSAAEILTKQNMRNANELMNLSAKHMQNFAGIRKPEDLFNLQTNFMNELTNKFLTQVKEFIENSQAISAECNQLFQESVKSTMEETRRAKNQAEEMMTGKSKK